ncbi:hypothetical protein OK016_25745 [Vibrio chagasii]|nr:hypothetical protein [Vibrio chagasii]
MANVTLALLKGEIANVGRWRWSSLKTLKPSIKQYYVDDNLQGLPTLLGTKDKDTLAQTMVFQSQLDDFWQRYQGELVAIQRSLR